MFFAKASLLGLLLGKSGAALRQSALRAEVSDSPAFQEGGE
jgi:hypothetical protein